MPFLPSTHSKRPLPSHPCVQPHPHYYTCHCSHYVFHSFPGNHPQFLSLLFHQRAITKLVIQLHAETKNRW
ncbi:unnamed protein product [Chondrus crispus]|uniref:Uncharacterized protein n=1 Tax=Chondrus crispus TaxID=2769 RepID=R7Q897_CHOCR|nr:unnamed protein product [Chondrus crispus]CDF33601.1 unnamed protein product [Chondrus crispus]|eukprot:XP_005713404.1 unnamed protein product [Chondrus crispus]